MSIGQARLKNGCLKLTTKGVIGPLRMTGPESLRRKLPRLLRACAGVEGSQNVASLAIHDGFSLLTSGAGRGVVLKAGQSALQRLVLLHFFTSFPSFPRTRPPWFQGTRLIMLRYRRMSRASRHQLSNRLMEQTRSAASTLELSPIKSRYLWKGRKLDASCENQIRIFPTSW